MGDFVYVYILYRGNYYRAPTAFVDPEWVGDQCLQRQTLIVNP